VQLLAAAWRERGATTADVLASDEARALAEAVLSSEPTEVQDFLLATSVLGRFTAGLCRAVTGSPNAGRMLRDVAHAGLFVVPLDEEQGWFRYNRLFAELLQRELERRDPGAARGLRRRAAAWFGDQHLAPEAVRHLVDAGDLAEAFSIVSRDPYNASWGQLLGVPWNELFPADWVEHEPSRMLHFATLLGRSGHLEEATGWLQRAHDAISELPAEDPLRALLASAGALWCGVTLNARRTVNLGAEVLKRPPGEASGDQPGDFHVRVRVAMIAAYLVLDDLDQAERVCAELDVPLSTEIIRGVIVPGFRARLALRRGELHLAEELAHRVLRTAHAMGIPNHPGIREAQFALGRALAERGDLAGAEKFIERAATTADGLGWPAVASYYRIGLAVVRAAADGPEAGIAVLADLRSTLVQAMAGPEVLDALDLQEARLRIDLGELDLAAEMLDDLPLSVQANLMRIRLALAQGDTAEAYAWWTEITPSNRRDQLVHDLLGARLAAAAGDEAERDRLLMAGARAGAAEHLHRMFVDNGRELLPLLADLGGHDPHLVHLVEQVALVGRHLGPPGGGLSEREAVVLRYLASTLTHNEIANELDVSTNTVKSHVRALYRKLGVRSRSEAVAAARRRALI
jgi:LuxR family maltose regulon positive regulatory protein